jgi:hypothetical protein
VTANHIVVTSARGMWLYSTRTEFVIVEVGGNWLLPSVSLRHVPQCPGRRLRVRSYDVHLMYELYSIMSMKCPHSSMPLIDHHCARKIHAVAPRRFRFGTGGHSLNWHLQNTVLVMGPHFRGDRKPISKNFGPQPKVRLLCCMALLPDW